MFIIPFLISRRPSRDRNPECSGLEMGIGISGFFTRFLLSANIGIISVPCEVLRGSRLRRMMTSDERDYLVF